jgi:hypothetical protein
MPDVRVGGRYGADDAAADLTAKIDAAVTDAVTSTGATFTMPDGKLEQFRVAPE